MKLPKQTQALRYHSFGKPEETLRLEELPLPNLAPGEALLKVLAAPINPADLGRIGGTYGELAELPAVAGLEGVGEIVGLGSDSSQLRVGQRVFVPARAGSWQSHAVAFQDELYAAPESLPLEIAAMGWVNPPTAWKLIHDFAKLEPGDWIVQNAATSAVGKLVIQFARHLGLRTLNLVRSLHAAERLRELGADIVLLDDKDAGKAGLDATSGAKAKLGLNAVGGASAYTECKLLADGSPLVTFGGMDRDPAPFPTRYLIFNDLRLRGLWVSRWYATAPRAEIEALHADVFGFMASAKVQIDVAHRYSLADYKIALASAQEPGKPGKTLFA